MTQSIEVVRPTTVAARWHLAGEDAARLVKETLAVVPRARAMQGVSQFEFYASADTPGSFLLYAQLDDPTAIEPLLAYPHEAERSDWVNAGSFRGIDAGEGGFSGDAGHVTFVRFTLQPGALQVLLDESQADIESTRGVKRFDLNISRSDPLQGLICARWVNRLAWEEHNAGPHYLAMAARMGALYDGPPKRTLWKAVAVPA